MQHLVDTNDLSMEQIGQIIEDARRFKAHYPPQPEHEALLKWLPNGWGLL